MEAQRLLRRELHRKWSRYRIGIMWERRRTCGYSLAQKNMLWWGGLVLTGDAITVELNLSSKHGQQQRGRGSDNSFPPE